MTYQAEVLADAPGGYWRLNDLASPAVSAGSTALSLAQAGGVTFGAAAASTELGTACQFDGTDDVLTHTTAADANALRRVTATPSYTVEVWIRPTSALSNIRGIYVHRDAAGSTQAAVFTTTAGFLAFDLSNGTAGTGRWTTTYSPPVNAWTHVVFTYNSATTTRSLYINGALNQTLVQAAPATVATAGRVSIGAATNSGVAASFWTGLIDEVAAYPGVALSGARILAHYNAAALAPPATTGYPKVFTGGSWQRKPAKAFVAGSWQVKPVKRWNGSAWVAA